MAGNVSEWVLDDWSGRYPEGPLTDPYVFGTNSADTVYRGGSFQGEPAELQLGSRFHRHTRDRREQLGFRLVRRAPHETTWSAGRCGAARPSATRPTP